MKRQRMLPDVTTDDDVFLAPILRGRRFDGHTVPVEVLADLAAYKDLVIEVARSLYLTKHPGRKRVPRGFVESFRLTLKQIDHGSAIPLLVIERDASIPVQQALDGFGDGQDFLDARDLIAECVRAVGEGRDPPPRFPHELLTSFNRFGRSLLPDESIELAPTRQTTGVRYDAAVRRKLVLRESRNYEKPLTLVGKVTDVSTRNATLVLQSSYGSIPASFPIHVERTVCDVLPSDADQVRVIGMGLYDRSERLLRITDISQVVLLDEAASEATAGILARLEAMADLEAGWHDGDGVAPDRSTVEFAKTVLSEIVDREGLPAPAVFPAPDGGIQAEWLGTPWSVEIRFLPGGRQVQAIADNLPEGRDESRIFVADEQVPADLAAWLRQFLSSSRRDA